MDRNCWSLNRQKVNSIEEVICIKRQILVIANDLAICQSIRDSMQDNLTDICCITSSVKALASYMRKDYCLVILDIQLSDVDSVDLLQTMRYAKHTPIMVLTEPEMDKASLLHTGADACIEKPVDPMVCAAQANALIQLYFNADINHDHHSPIIHSNVLVISPRYRQVTFHGKALKLTRTEYNILYCLASHPGQIFSRDQLYELVWNNDIAVSVDEAVKSQIKSLRKKLAPKGKEYIQNQWGVGYKFVLIDEE